MFEWIKCEYGKGVIDRAGRFLVDWWLGPDPTPKDLDVDQWHKSFQVIENWRSCHSLPLNVVQSGLRQRAQKVEREVIVAQRLKRFPSIMNKLARESSMKLSQMQDLGGCRAILSDVQRVNAVYKTYRDRTIPLLDEAPVKFYDYIADPKADGYRGIHVAARYHPRKDERQPWGGCRIEIQLRTKLQHAFSTAVETVTTFTREPLKFGAGPEEWRRFFSLMGSALAIREGTALVPNTPGNERDLVSELRNAAEELRVRPRLEGWADAIHTFPRHNMRDFKWILLELNTTAKSIKATGFRDRNVAAQAIAEIEKSKRPEIDAVLVWVNSIKGLRAAYPNYYADTKQFLDALESALTSKR
jgi:ppGpp synthetase/RelA/SpoT-type nucleotidyltranferase